MSRYRKVEVSLWGDRGFRELSAAPPSGQTLWLYLLTGPRTLPIPGVIVARPAVMADDLRWSMEGFQQAFGEVLSKGIVKADSDTGIVWIPRELTGTTGHGPVSSLAPMA